MASPTTKYERLGNIFGTPLDILDPNCLPKKAEVVRLWMGLFDTSRTSRNLSPEKKFQVKSEVLTAVVSIWKLKGHAVCSKKTLERKYDRLISEADSLGKNQKCKENDRVWIDSQWKLHKYDTLFDIGESAPNTPLKRKSEELGDPDMVSSHTAHFDEIFPLEITKYLKIRYSFLW